MINSDLKKTEAQTVIQERQEGISAPLAAESAKLASAGSASSRERPPDSWAAYGRFLHAAVRTRSQRLVAPTEGNLHQFRRHICGFDSSMVYAFYDCVSPETGIWIAAEKALKEIASKSPLDQLNLNLPGRMEPSDGDTLHTALDGAYIGLAIAHDTRDILPIHGSFDDFLQRLGRSNRRKMRVHFKEALELGLRFELSSDPLTPDPELRYRLGKQSRPAPYPRELVDAYEQLLQAQPGLFHASLYSSKCELLSFCSGFVEQDSALVMYQFNHKDYPKLALSMTLRTFLVKHWCNEGIIQRVIFPNGMNGHLTHATTLNPVVQIIFARRSLVGILKVLLGAILVPTSDAARMVRAKGFLRRVFAG